MIEKLIGRKICIIENEFVSNSTLGIIEKYDSFNNKFLIRLDKKLNINGTEFNYVVASIRLNNNSLNDIVTNKSVGCALTWVPVSIFNQDDPMDLSWWRGGATAISDVVLCN